jgi:3'-phosphoadenosine 5'-phosphosulfate sulfotransferase (PAPS reductase)/FAD synthetase
LRPNPRNWKTHPQLQQDAMRGMLAEIGYADALLVRQMSDGSLELIDGHLRAEVTPEMKVPVLVLDLDEQEAAKLLALYDPLASLAESNNDVLAHLLEQVETENQSLQSILDQMLSQAEASLQDQCAQDSDFRRGMSALSNRISDWRGVDDFLECPGEVRSVLDTKTCFIVLFSDGKDSLSTLLWARHSFPDVKCFTVFCDTGVEFPAIGAYVAEISEYMQTESVVVKPSTEWWSWLRQKGRWPSLLYRECAQRMIHVPIARWIRANCKPGTSALLTGSRADEAVRGSQKATSSLTSLGSDADRYFHFAPCFNVKKSTLDEVLRRSGIPLWPASSGAPGQLPWPRQ